MPLRFGNESIAAKKLAAQKRLAERQASLATSEKIIANVDTDRDSIAAREHAGELSAKQAADAFSEVDEKERRHRSEIDRLTRAVALSESEIEGLERDEELDAFEEAAGRAATARKAAVSASNGHAKLLMQIKNSTPRLVRARELADQLEATAAALHPDGELAGSPTLVDEPDWPRKAELKESVDVALAGPLQPNADGVASAEQADAARKRQDDETIRQCIAGLPGLINASFVEQEINRLPERLRERAWAQARKANADARKVSEDGAARQRAQQPQRVLR